MLTFCQGCRLCSPNKRDNFLWWLKNVSVMKYKQWWAETSCIVKPSHQTVQSPTLLWPILLESFLLPCCALPYLYCPSPYLFCILQGLCLLLSIGRNLQAADTTINSIWTSFFLMHWLALGIHNWSFKMHHMYIYKNLHQTFLGFVVSFTIYLCFNI